MIKVKPITSNDEWNALVEEAAKDNHYPLGATHFVTKGDEIVGSFNVGPFICWWLRADQTLRETVVVGKELQNIIKDVGLKEFAMFVSEDSPYYGHMKRMGFQADEGNYTLFMQVEDFNNVWT